MDPWTYLLSHQALAPSQAFTCQIAATTTVVIDTDISVYIFCFPFTTVSS